MNNFLYLIFFFAKVHKNFLIVDLMIWLFGDLFKV